MRERRKFQAGVQRSWGRNVLGVIEDGKRTAQKKHDLDFAIFGIVLWNFWYCS